MERGYIRLWRKVMDCKMLHEPGKVYSKFEAWIDLVAFEAAGVPRNGLQRGEFVASVRLLSRKWHWSKSKVERFLAELQSGPDPMIMRVGQSAGQSAGHFAGHFTVCKYDIYNPLRDSQRDTSRDTSRDTYIKEGFKEGLKEGQKTAAGAAAVDLPPSVREAERLSELLRGRIAVRDGGARAARLPVPSAWVRDIEKLIRVDGRRPEDIEAVIEWCQSDGCWWGPSITSGRKLREKFDTMWGQMKRARAKSYQPDTVGSEDPEKAAQDQIPQHEVDDSWITAFRERPGLRREYPAIWERLKDRLEEPLEKEH